MGKQTIKFQPVHPEPPSKGKAAFRGKKQKPDKDLPLKIYLNSLAVGFIRVDPKITIFIKGTQLKGRFQSLGAAKAHAINHITENLK